MPNSFDSQRYHGWNRHIAIHNIDLIRRPHLITAQYAAFAHQRRVTAIHRSLNWLRPQDDCHHERNDQKTGVQYENDGTLLHSIKKKLMFVNVLIRHAIILQSYNYHRVTNEISTNSCFINEQELFTLTHNDTKELLATYLHKSRSLLANN
ncbi:hypothetical protein [Chloroflexus sp.]|uniref:hypothetical protein n=1 Tax=Chloroflexus sp. TaxID=1904827 RepID=UPI003C73BB50